MFNISPIGVKTVNSYGSVSKSNAVQSTNPFFQKDSFSISDDAMILSAALSEAKVAINHEMGKLDADKINALKAQINEGCYSVSGYQVANKLLTD